MKLSIACLAAALVAPAAAVAEWTTVYSPSTQLANAVRGQSPGYEESPGGGFAMQTSATSRQALRVDPVAYDPFLGATGPNGAGPIVTGPNGPQPFRYGWTSRYDVGWLPQSDTSTPPGFGDFGVFEFNAAWEYATPLGPNWNNWILSMTPQFGLRAWDGPSTGLAPGLPGSVYRFAADVELTAPLSSSWSVQVAGTPTLATDFGQSPGSDAWLFDGRAIAFYQMNPQWMFALGAGYWDRVHTHIVPYAGVVWTPDDRWEFRLLFPESRISYFLGIMDGFAKWVYVSGEYHIEAYEVELQPVARRDQVELRDWRLLLGLRMERAGLTLFAEAGGVLGREVDFLGTNANDFDVSSGLIARFGVRY